MRSPRSYLSLSLVALFLALIPHESHAQEYVLVGWNDLGMHCSNKNFSKVVVLPPYNNVTAQLILRMPGQPPQIVTSGYSVEYSILNNTYSVGKTDFWTYAQALFGLPAPLAPNVGLTGKGLTGVLDSANGAFSARGIPVTPYADSDLVHETPFQLIHLEAKRSSDGTLLSATDAVIPVSNEVGCVQSGCHASEASILNSHEDVSGFNRNGPVLCASCHASNALGTVGIPEARPFSYRMHSMHRDVAGAKNAIATCYKCHPGPNTQCLRDIMGKNPTSPMVCQNCHGTMDTVAVSISRGRRPWLDEPQCGKCHGSAYAEEPGKLFRQSKGHGGLYCSACHGSPHAILPTVQPNDNLQNIRLQGYAGTLRKCSVCHAEPPNGPGPHGIIDTANVVVATPTLSSPPNRSVGVTKNPTVQWQASPFARGYELQLATDSAFAALVSDDSAITRPWYTAGMLDSNRVYFWRVCAIGPSGHTPWSEAWSFTTANGMVISFAVNRFWNLVSLPTADGRAAVSSVFPAAMTQAFSFSGSAGYQQSDSLTHGTGYWLRFSTAQPVSLTGTPLTSDTIPLALGWNLIGAIADSLPVAAMTTIPPGIITSPIFGYNGGYVQSDALAPGNGYWATANAEGSLILNRAVVAKEAVRSFADRSAAWDKIRVSDAAGNSQSLFFSRDPDEGALRASYALPPKPPQGTFDVRFASERFLEVYSPGQTQKFSIQISSAVYPVTITWSLHAGSPLRTIASDDQATSVQDYPSALLPREQAEVYAVTSSFPSTPEAFVLEQNYPNPFNPTTMLRYGLPFESRVRMSIYNVSGERVAEFSYASQGAGFHEIHWSPDAASGIYFYKLEAIRVGAPDQVFTSVKKMLLIR